MTSAESAALLLVHGFAKANRIILSKHARQRMRERGVEFVDLRVALTNATSCAAARSRNGGSQGRTRTATLSHASLHSKAKS
jgi:hypothetical protein